MPAPGTIRRGVVVSAGNRSDVSGADGIATLGGVGAGVLDVHLDGLAAQASVTIVERELVELALAADGDAAAILVEVSDRHAAAAVVLTPDMTPAEVQSVLAMSHTVVFVRSSAKGSTAAASSSMGT